MSREQNSSRDRQIGDLRLTERLYKPKQKMPAHSHELPAFSFVLSGSYDERVGQRLKRKCSPSTLIVHTADETHAVEFHDAQTKIFRVNFAPAWLDRTEDCWETLKESTTLRGGKIAAIAERMYAEFRSPDSFSVLAVEGLTLELMAEVGRGLARCDERNVPRWLERVREMLHERFSEAASLNTVAEAVGVHPVYLARQFRKFYRMTVGDYVRRLRIESAAEQLSSTDLTISEIAVETGFYDQSHLSNVFKKHTGLTPAEFRINKRAS